MLNNDSIYCFAVFVFNKRNRVEKNVKVIFILICYIFQNSESPPTLSFQFIRYVVCIENNLLPRFLWTGQRTFLKRNLNSVVINRMIVFDAPDDKFLYYFLWVHSTTRMLKTNFDNHALPAFLGLLGLPSYYRLWLHQKPVEAR